MQHLTMKCRINRVTLDGIGIAGFGHDFNTLSSSPPPSSLAVLDAFEMLGKNPPGVLHIIFFVLSQSSLIPILPLLQKLPTERKRVLDQYRKVIEEIAVDLLENARKKRASKGEKAADVEDSLAGPSRSIIGTLGASLVYRGF